MRRPGLVSRVRSWWRRGAPLRPAKVRGYDAVNQTRLRGGWQRAGTDAVAEAQAGIQPLREYARELVRNDAYAFSGVSVLVNNLVGEGLQPRSICSHGKAVMPADAMRGFPRETLDQRTERVWREWSEDASTDGQLDAFGLQSLSARGLVESGEVLVRRRWRRLSDGLIAPVQIELLEADMLDHQRTEIRGKNEILQGVEFDVLGRRVAYWLYPRHPGGVVPGFGSSYQDSRRLLASEVSHCFEPLRPGAVRGITWLAPVMLQLMQYKDYTDAELERKRLEASIFASVSGLEGTDLAFQPSGTDEGNSVPARVTNSDGIPIEEIEAGTILYPPMGADMKIHAPSSIGGVAEFRKQELQAIAVGLRMCYVLLTGDLSGTNYSSIRAGLIEFRRFVKSVRRAIFTRQICRPLWNWPIEAAQTAGVLPYIGADGARIRYRAAWTPPAFESVDREKDAKADALELANYLTSVGRILQEKGLVPDDVWADIQAWDERFTAAGIVPQWKSSGRSSAPEVGSGAPQADEEPADEEPADESDESTGENETEA